MTTWAARFVEAVISASLIVLAGDCGRRGCGFHRHVPRRQPRPHHRSWAHMDLRLPVPAPRRQRDDQPHRLCVRLSGGSGLGEPGTPDVDIAVLPYPSDHRAVVSTVQIDPVEPPVFVAVEQVRVAVGERFVVRFGSCGIAPGEYTVVLTGAEYQELSRAR